MGIPVMVFAKFVARPEYYQLGEQERGAAWWKVVGELGKQAQAAGIQTLAAGRSVGNGPIFCNVSKYPDMETYLEWMRIWNNKTHMQKYFDISTLEFFCADEDLTKALGEIKYEKASW